MVTLSLSQFADDINQHINSHDDLDTKLRQANSLARMGENADFDILSKETIRHYLMALTEFIDDAVQLSEHLSQELSRLAYKVRHHQNQ